MRGTDPGSNHFTNSLSRRLLTCADSAAREAGAILLQWRGRVHPREKSPADLVTEADEAAQQAIEYRLTQEFPDFYFVGEEDSAQTAGATRGTDVARKSNYGWIVDPLDGTTNYVHGMDDFCVSIALRRGGQIMLGVIYDPVRDQLFHAIRGEGAFLSGQRLRVSGATALNQALVAASFSARVLPESPEVQRFLQVLARAQAIRRLGSAALNLAYLADGRLDAYWASSVKLWDVAAGLLCVEEAGGQISSLDGSPLNLDRPCLAVSATSALHADLLRALTLADDGR
jgi:myo-inositol-1(or 4)-monophosphatase